MTYPLYVVRRTNQWTEASRFMSCVGGGMCRWTPDLRLADVFATESYARTMISGYVPAFPGESYAVVDLEQAEADLVAETLGRGRA